MIISTNTKARPRAVYAHSKPIFRCIFVVTLVSVQWFSGRVLAADLLDIYHLAQKKDPTYEAGRYALESAQEKQPQALANLLPQVLANANRNRNIGVYNFGALPESERNVKASGWTVQLTQPLIRIQNWENYSQAEFLVEQARARFALVEQDLILRTAQAYFDFDIARESIFAADAQVLAVQQQLNLNKKGFIAGTLAITDVHEVQARLELARSQRVGTQNDLDSKSAELEKIIGFLPISLNSLRGDAELSFPDPNNVQYWIKQAREISPSVRLQRAAVGVAEKEISKNNAAHLPTLDLTASYGRNYSSGNNTTIQDYDSRNRSTQIGLQLSIPLNSGGMVSSRVREATAQFYQAKAELETAERLVATTARQAFSGVSNGMAQIDALASAIESSRHAVKGNQMGLKLGTRINIDVLNAEQQLYTSQRDLVKARYGVLLQSLKLKAAAGQLFEIDISNLNLMFKATP